jgi:predicted MFS family arabinose efflux permease
MTEFTKQEANTKIDKTSYHLLAGLFLVHFFASMDRYAFTILLEPIKADLQASDTQMGILSGLAFVICYVIFGIPLARMIDTGVRKTLVIATLAIWSAVTALSSLASSVLGMGIFRAALGSAEAGAIPASLSMIADSFPKQRRHQAVSIFQLGAGISPILGVPIVAIIADNFGWRAAMTVMGLGGLVLAVALIPFLKEPVRGHYDAPSENIEPVSLIASIRTLGKNSGLVFHVLSHIAITCTSTIFVIWVSAYCVRVLKFTVTEAGIVAGASGVLTVIGILGGGWICGKLSETKQDDRWIAAFSGIVAVISAAGLVVMLSSTSRAVFIIGFALVSLALFSRIAPAMTLATDLAPPRMRGLSSSLMVGLASLIAGGLAPVAMGRLSDHLAVDHGSAEGLRMALLYTMVPCALIGAVLAGIAILMIGAPGKPAQQG